MQELGVLAILVPEFRALDSLVVRDFYHRYTVDEHTFLTIDALHHLSKDSDQERHFAELPWRSRASRPAVPGAAAA